MHQLIREGFQFVNTYGLKSFIARCEELEKVGSRFKCPQIVIDKESWRHLRVIGVIKFHIIESRVAFSNTGNFSPNFDIA